MKGSANTLSAISSVSRPGNDWSISDIGVEEWQAAADEMFDGLARSLRNGMSRRKAFALIIKGLIGVALAEVGVKSAWAADTCLCRGQTYDATTACCTPTGVRRKHPIAKISECPNKIPHPNYVLGEPNGCGGEGSVFTPFIPNRFGFANFRECCNTHDGCYGTCNNDKTSCDDTFGPCLVRACVNAYALEASVLASCLSVAAVYYGFVRVRGGSFFEAAQSGACDCCSESTCPQSCAGSSCGALPSCAGGADCLCFTSTEGTGACVHGSTPCAGIRTCVTSADCPPGSACLTTSCCGSFGVCGPLCNPVTPASSTVALPQVKAKGPTLGHR